MSNATGGRRQSKNRIIREYCQAHRLERVGTAEIRAIQAELQNQLGDSGRTSLAYIARMLRESGVQLQTPIPPPSPYVESSLQEPYTARLKGLLKFADLASAEKSIRDLDAAHREYEAAGDFVGMRLVRALALKGKMRAGSLSANPRVSSQKRQEKQEIAFWFRVWLQSPSLFTEWLELRKSSDEFKRIFPLLDQTQAVP